MPLRADDTDRAKQHFFAGLAAYEARDYATAETQFKAALAIVPGTSRSGVTIATGLFRRFDRVAAARFSFLLSTPVIPGAAFSALLHLRKHARIPPTTRSPFSAGTAVAPPAARAAPPPFCRLLRTRPPPPTAAPHSCSGATAQPVRRHSTLPGPVTPRAATTREPSGRRCLR